MNQAESGLRPANQAAGAKRAASWEHAKRNLLPAFISQRLFGRALAPTLEEWSAVNEDLYRGDPPMDRVVDWFFENDPRHSKALFEQALTRGIESLPDPPEPLREFFAIVDARPAWFNADRAEAGMKASRLAGDVAFYYLRDLALMGGYAYFNTTNQTLAIAGALHRNAGLRIGETGKWLDDISEPGGLDRFGAGFISTLRVRLIHALIRRSVRAKDAWRTEDWGVPINQIDLLATYLAFGPVALTGIRLFGVFPTRGESANSVHAWRYVGWLCGVDERWLATTEGDAFRKLYHAYLTHECPDEKIRLMGEALKNEPLSRPIPSLSDRPPLERLARLYSYHKHISNSALIMGSRRKRQLGLPVLSIPWYPLLTALPRFITISYYRVRGGLAFERFLQRNRKKQKALSAVYFDDGEKQLLRPESDHPAHVG